MALLRYFQREIDYLRTAGGLFAKNHPKLGRHLDFKGRTDPHVERLIESFAFLTARIQQEIDRRMPEMARQLLSVLYPHLERPFPSASIAEFKPAPKLTHGALIPKHTSLIAKGDVPCRFRTTRDITLWPVNIKGLKIVSQADMLKGCFRAPQPKGEFALKLTLNSAQPDFGGMIDLFIHLAGERSWSLWQEGVAHENPFIVVKRDDKSVFIDNGIIPGGWEEPLVDPPLFADASLAFVQEFSHFPKKFSFWKLQHLDKAKELFAAHGDVDIFIPLKDGRDLARQPPNLSYFKLGCVPIVNLFRKISDPIRWDHKKVFYRVVPDQRRDRTTEVYSVEKVMGTLEKGGDFELIPYFSIQHHTAESNHVYWLGKRQSAEDRELPGSDMYISFVDLKFQWSEPPTPVMYAHTLCTNRFVAAEIPPDSVLQSEEGLPISSITCIYKPSEPAYAPTDGESLWKLISQLASHHLNFAEGANSLAVLQELMVLHGDGQGTASTLNLIKKMTAKTVVRRRPLERQEAWRGFVEGVELNLLCKDDPMVFLTTLLLRKLFKTHIHIQSFIEFVLENEDSQSKLHLGHDWGLAASS